MQKHADRSDKRPPIIAGPSSLQHELYWPKMDPSLYQGHDRLDPYGQGLMDPTRFHPGFAEDLRQQGYAMGGGGGWGTDPSKAASAFSPINGAGVLPTSAGFNMGTGTRGYPFYDPISFQRQSQVRICFFRTSFLKKIKNILFLKSKCKSLNKPKYVLNYLEL